MLGRLFILIGGLFVLALTAALVAPYFIDWTNYRADFEREASAVLGRKVTVRGEASARILPFPSVTFSDVQVGADGAEPAMTVETFSMDAELAPFMSGEFRIFDMRLVRPKATVAIAADGTIDWTVRPSAPISARQISLERLTITDGQVTVHHAASGRDHLLTRIDVDASARSLLGPWRIDGSLLADGEQVGIGISTGVVEDGAMRLMMRTRPSAFPIEVETDGSVRVENGAASYAGTLRIVPQEDVKAELRGSDGAAPKADRAAAASRNRLTGKFTFDQKRLALDSFRFETGPVADPYVAEGEASIDIGPAPRFAIVANGAQVRLDENGKSGRYEGARSLDQRLAAAQAVLAALPRPTIPGTVDINLPAIVAGDTTVRDVRLSAEPVGAGWTVKSLAATLPGRTTVEAHGDLATAPGLAFKGDLLVAIAQPSGFMAWLSKNVDDAIRRVPRAGFSAKVDLTAERQRFADLELQLGDARFEGELDSRRPGDARPAVALTLDGGALDFEGVSAFASLLAGADGKSIFGDADLDLALKAGPVTVAGMTADKLDTALRFRGAAIEVDRMSIGGLAGATISATASLRNFPREPEGKIDASIVATDLQPLLDLAAQRFPEQALIGRLRESGAAYGGLFADSEVDVVADASIGDSGRPIYSLNARGTAGGTAFSGSYLGPLDDPDADVLLSFEGKNSDATALLALYGASALPLGLTGPGETSVTAEGSWAKGLKTSFRLAGHDATATFEGTASSGDQGLAVKGRAALDAADIEPWLMTMGLGLPGMGIGTTVQLDADADYASGLLVLSSLKGTVAEGAVAGDVNLEVKDGLPRLSGQLSVDDFDLYPLARVVLGEDTLESDGAGWATKPFQQKSMTPVLAELDMTAGNLGAGPVASVGDAHFDLRLDREGIRVSDLTGTLDDGKVSGFLELKNDGGTGLLSAQLKLADADLAQFAEGLNLGGRGDFSAALTANGKTLEGIVAALSGSGTASLKSLVIPGINPDAFPALLVEAEKAGRDIDAVRTAAFAPPIVAAGSYDPGSVDLAFTVVGGVLRAPPVTMPAPAASLTAEVRGDLNDGTVSATGSIAYAPGPEALAGSEPTVGFAVSGPPGGLSATFDTEPLAQFLTQRALEKEQMRVEAMQAALLERQRLRREVRYYTTLAAERERLAAERRRAEQDALRKAEDAAVVKEQEEQKRKDAEAEAAAKAQAEEAKRAAEKAGQQDPKPPAPRRKAPAQQEGAPEPQLLPMDSDAFDTSPATQPAQKKGLIERLFGN